MIAMRTMSPALLGASFCVDVLWARWLGATECEVCGATEPDCSCPSCGEHECDCTDQSFEDEADERVRLWSEYNPTRGAK